MDFTLHIDLHVLSMGLSILYFKGSHVYYFNYNAFQSLNVVFILVNSADPDEMQHYASFHLGLRYLPKYQFGCFQYT